MANQEITKYSRALKDSPISRYSSTRTTTHAGIRSTLCLLRERRRLQPSLRGMDDPGFQYYHLPFLLHLLQALTALADSRKTH